METKVVFDWNTCMCVCVYIDISYYGVIVRASRTIDVDMQVEAVLSLLLNVIDKNEQIK